MDPKFEIGSTVPKDRQPSAIFFRLVKTDLTPPMTLKGREIDVFLTGKLFLFLET